jgi:hypothetical protein
MNSIWLSKGEKIHTRNIEVTAYAYDEQRIIVEGSLKDDRYSYSYTITGEKLPNGIIHHMTIRLLVNCSNLLIEDVDVDMISVPREECRETVESLAPIKGLTITKGFTSKAKKIAGGKKGCTHLMELLLVIAPAAVQGSLAYRSRKQADFDPDRARTILQFLINTCRVWREDGPLVERFKKMIDMK